MKEKKVKLPFLTWGCLEQEEKGGHEHLRELMHPFLYAEYGRAYINKYSDKMTIILYIN